MAKAGLSRRERWTLGLILGGSLLAGFLLAGLPEAIEQQITLVAGVALFPLVLVRVGVYAWHCQQQRQRLLAALGALLLLLLSLGFIGELAKLFLPG
jgi:hypothetical protein